MSKHSMATDPEFVDLIDQALEKLGKSIQDSEILSYSVETMEIIFNVRLAVKVKRK